jgi:hypothetical protein
MSTKEPGVNAVSGHDVDLCDGASTPALKTRTAKPRETRMEWTYYSDVEVAMQKGRLRFDEAGNIQAYPSHFVSVTWECRNDTRMY